MSALLPAVRTRNGLTLIELLLAISLMAAISAVTYFTFEAGTRAWRSGLEVSDSLHHADFVMEQLVMGLRSACYPDANRPSGSHGLVLINRGDDEQAQDTLSWVKLGTALVGSDAPFAGTPHRVEVTVTPPGHSAEPELAAGGLTVSAWRIIALPDDFDPAMAVKPMILTPRIVGFNCRVLDPEKNLERGQAPKLEDELEWLDEWENDYTNRLPYAVELSLYLEPAREREPPIEIKRIVEIPLAPLSWRDKGAAGGQTETGGTQQQSTRQRSNVRRNSQERLEPQQQQQERRSGRLPESGYRPGADSSPTRQGNQPSRRSVPVNREVVL